MMFIYSKMISTVKLINISSSSFNYLFFEMLVKGYKAAVM